MRLARGTFAKDMVGIVLLSLFAGYVFTDALVSVHGLYWDNPLFYSIFWNNLHALNHYGQVAWWFPANQTGWPSYYYSILGDISHATPGFVPFGFASWISGVLGVEIDSFYGFYIAYQAYWVPYLVNVGVYLVARQILRSRAAIWYALAMSAFSPAVLTNISDIGFLEPLAYGLFFFAAWNAYISTPKVRTFLYLTLASCLIALGLGYPFILWNLFFVPIVILLTSFVPLQSLRKVKAAFLYPSLKQWGFFAFTFILCMLPAILTYSQTGDLIRSSLGQEVYDFKKINPGNPLETFFISVPHFGFEWNGQREWGARPAKAQHIASVYLGLAALSFSIIGLIFGARIVKLRILLAVLFFTAVATLSAKSPFFSILIRSIRPLQTNNHYSDLLFRSGAFLIFVLLAALGFQFIKETKSKKVARLLPLLFLINTIISVSIFIFAYDFGVLANNHFGLMLLMSLLTFAAMMWWTKKRVGRLSNYLMITVLLLLFVDLATFNYLHMNTIGYESKKVLVLPETRSKEFPGLEPIFDYSDHILLYKQLFALRAAEMPPIDRFRLFSTIHTNPGQSLEESIQTEKAKFAKTGFSTYASLLVDDQAANIPELQSFTTPTAPAQGQIDLVEQSYNHLRAKVTSSKAAVLFIRDGFSPYWQASVEGKTVPIGRALFNYKAIPVPAGTSELLLKFRPPFVPWALLFAWITILSLAAYTARLSWRERKTA